ncbi:G-type lectin S-receptor-like serine/threonine-protein kinase At5g35370 [Brachypodium distachyon]|uniref:non-specific serine/threonine protein kinase n=1 Tax=Brachypodium distachyon TaxID=15368 RepID=I1IFY2_BRADI|nr:G-type lectin S-receptor-like serine/threonine-protein kinase At5g35370 [Brachypodium distachyon]KQJ85553.1 hypothetical protein BRADI_4g00206v3 [Brachypodium distachyon]|eukprot:XP_003579074.1 G-type lectin S-receptor-like serine/threonine-protein kinase At5g35370 [Brachypodium distachyon]
MALPPPLRLLLQLLVVFLGTGGPLTAARTVPVEFLYPPFNLTYMHYIDTNGVFLLSGPNGTFSAAVYNAGSGGGSSFDSQSRFFFSVLHDKSRTPVWTATAGSTILQSITLSLTAKGMALSYPADPDPAWSTPPLAAPVASLRLRDTGELALLDAANATLWSSFDRPTDTLLQGQRLPVGATLTASASDQDLSPGPYRLLLTPNDALLQWAPASSSSAPANASSLVTYWALSSDAGAVQDSNLKVESMAVNASGIYLLAGNGRDTVLRLLFTPPPSSSSAKVLLKVGSSGRLRVLSMAISPTAARASLPSVWEAPGNDCDLPLPCGSLGLCTAGTGSNSSCMCPEAFSTHTTGGCSPADGSTTLLPTDDCANGSSSSSYTGLGDGVGYFASKFAVPATAGGALPACRDLCSANCSCLGFHYRNSSKSCFLMLNQIGSVFRVNADSFSSTAAAVFIKTVPAASRGHGRGSSRLSSITIVFGVVLPTVAAVFIAFLLYVMAKHWLNKRGGSNGQKKKKKKKKKKTKHESSEGWRRSWFMLHVMSSSRASSNVPSEKDTEEDSEEEDDDPDAVLIPGLPTRFTFDELEAATNGFKRQIGSGGFGSVYRGSLPDGTTVAVKRMNNLGTQGRREFLTEIAVIGNVHHVNLVKLRGFCAEGPQRQLLVYEFMSRGSLDQSLFVSSNSGLAWPERVGVCVGAARGLAYLHSGCHRKILHCDVKPENILLDGRGGVKIADFGLAKLMSPEQSGLFTTMRGTRGYLAPEWLMNAPITDKADVYSFGMVLLEIVRGRKNSKLLDDTGTSSGASDDGGKEERSRGYFPAMALAVHEEEASPGYSELADPRLEGKVDAGEVSRVVRVALCCLHEEASLRPGMTAVAAMLDGSMEVCAPRTDQLSYLRMYGRAGTTAGAGAASSSTWSPPSCVSAQQLSAPR